MMDRFFFLIFLCLSSCAGKTQDINLKIIDSYVDIIKSRNDFNTSITEGSIYEISNNKIVGGFEFYEYFEEDKKELFRLEYISNTEKSIIENYFYKNNRLIYIEYIKDYELNNVPKVIYIKNDLVEYTPIQKKDLEKTLIKKGNDYLKSFIDSK